MPRRCSTCQVVYGDEYRGLRFCPVCRALLPPFAPGLARATAPDHDWPCQPASPALAALLSFLLVGMGQVYLGQVDKGLAMLGTVLLLMVTVALGPLGVVILLVNMLDAFLLARKAREGKPILSWEFFFSRGKTDGAGSVEEIRREGSCR